MVNLKHIPREAYYKTYPERLLASIISLLSEKFITSWAAKLQFILKVEW